MSSLMGLSNKEFKKELYKENIFIELSERLEIEMANTHINSSELGNALGKDEFYVEAILDGMLDIKLSEIAYIFAFFDKFTGIVPVSNEERIQVANIQDSSFIAFNKMTGKVKLCSDYEFSNHNFEAIHSLTLGLIKNEDKNKVHYFKYNKPSIESEKYTSLAESRCTNTPSLDGLINGIEYVHYK